MVWTAPSTFVDGNVLTAGELNSFLRDNMLETMPAKATGQLRHFVADGANRIVERQIFKDYIEAKEITTSTSYTDLSTVGPKVTVTTGTMALCSWDVSFDNNTVQTIISISVAVSGATTVAANDNQAMISRVYATALKEKRYGICEMVTGLTPGSNTFTLKYKTSAGTAVFSKRLLVVVAF